MIFKLFYKYRLLYKHFLNNLINYIRNGGLVMYYYGGYQGYGNGCGGYGGGYGSGYGAAIILVLFILLVIVIGTRAFGGNGCN